MKTVLNVKTDRDVKIEAQNLAKELGLSLSTIVNASLKQFIRSKGIFFSVEPFMTPELEKIISEVEKDKKNGNSLSKDFSNIDEAIAYLND